MKEVNTVHFSKRKKVQNKLDIVYILIICIYECVVLETFIVKLQTVLLHFLKYVRMEMNSYFLCVFN